MRRQYERTIDGAFKLGIKEAWQFWGMTPREINGRIRAHQVASNKRLEEMDALAFMVGQYAAIGYHNPKKYPRRPFSATRAEQAQGPMTDEQMKDAMLAFAQRHNERGEMNWQ